MPQEQPPRPTPLDYATPPKSPALGGVPYMGQMAIGCGAFWLLLIGAIVVLYVVLGRGAPGGYDADFWLLVGAGVTVLVVSAALSVVAWIRWRWPGFLTGILGGILSAILLSALIVAGIILLILYTCGKMR